MDLSKKIISIFLSLICFCPGVFAMKSSISLPENLCEYTHSTEDDFRDSPYELYRACDRIIMESPHTHIDKTIDDTTYVCIKTFRRIRDLLYDRDLPDDYLYIAGLLNYVPILEKMNHILHNIILNKNRNILAFFAPSPITKTNVNNAIFILSSAIKRYEQTFWIELNSTSPEPSRPQQIYDLMYNTWEGIWEISQLGNFRY